MWPFLFLSSFKFSSKCKPWTGLFLAAFHTAFLNLLMVKTWGLGAFRHLVPKCAQHQSHLAADFFSCSNTSWQIHFLANVIVLHFWDAVKFQDPCHMSVRVDCSHISTHLSVQSVFSFRSLISACVALPITSRTWILLLIRKFGNNLIWLSLPVALLAALGCFCADLGILNSWYHTKLLDTEMLYTFAQNYSLS